ncbi:unnamed protein product [Ranitomeya imitator]|uniref:Uncharacterized protein n=1 Tax=Ranitomeya imitator TaxID=111125 RepID=A0ABN9LPZ1_9NEOB|nr:unnamed protein product [Ranitomeya imitator]
MKLPAAAAEDFVELIQRATSVLLADPCFQLRSIHYLLGQSEGSAPPPADKKHFSLQAYTDYINAEELGKVEKMRSLLNEESKQAAASCQPTSEEDLCPICYAHTHLRYLQALLPQVLQVSMAAPLRHRRALQ